MADSTALTLDDALQVVADAFLPCGCVTSANPDGDSFGYTVMSGSGHELLSVTAVPRSDYSNAQLLAGVIEQARQELGDIGCELEPWSMPVDPDGGLPQNVPEVT